MSSFFTNIPGKTITGFAGTEYPLEFYIQFVPGTVVDVVTSPESLRYTGENTINSIIAKPYITDKPYVRNSNLGEDFRYYPLLRGMTEVPVKGDPVILCTLGKINYYLGPLNSNSNNPTWNDDLLSRSEIDLLQESVEISLEDLEATSPNFNKNILYKRLIKNHLPELDYGDAVFETTGDYIIEGRHGNSIRVGSRSDNPYIYLSNERGPENQIESITDGSLIGIISHGSLHHHFGNEIVPTDSEASLNVGESRPDGELPLNDAELKVGFTLASDTLQEPNRFMSSLVSNVNNNEDIQNLIYLYGAKKEEENYKDDRNIRKGENANQILINSDRITINTKLDDIYLSSIKDIHIGTGRHLTISTNEDLIISSERTFIGNPLLNGESREMESMVLGTTLLELLKETLAVIKNSQGICQGAPIALADETGIAGGVNKKITEIEQKIDQILSTKHFIEPNE